MDPLHSWSHPALRMTWRAVWDIRPVTGRGISPTFMASPVTLRPVQGGRNWVSRWYPWSDFEMLRRLLQHILHDLSSTKRVSWHIVFFFLIFFCCVGSILLHTRGTIGKWTHFCKFSDTHNIHQYPTSSRIAIAAIADLDVCQDHFHTFFF